MKRIALLIALALIVSVGGVYATWVYSDGAADQRDLSIENALTITGTADGGKKGVISITDTLVLTIDDNNGTHNPGWDADITGAEAGTLSILFTPNTGAPTTVFEYYLTITNYTYSGGSIFNVGEDKSNAIDGQQVIYGTFTYTNGDPNATQTFTCADIQNALGLNTSLKLDALSEYTEYKTALDNVKLTLTVQEKPAP